MDLNLDFTGVKRPSFEPIPEGEYVVTLSDLKIAPSKGNATSGKDNIVANGTYEVVSDTEGNSEYSGRKLFNAQVIAGTDARPEYVKLWLESLIGEPLTGEFSLDPDQLVGMECTVFVGVQPHYQDDNKMVNVIKYFIPGFDPED